MRYSISKTSWEFAMKRKYSIEDSIIIENATNVVIEVSNNIKEICDNLNSGKGFNGNTPNFFAKIMKVSN